MNFRRQLIGIVLPGIAISLLAGPARATDSPDLRIGPYLQSVLQDSAVVMWHTTTATTGRVEFGDPNADASFGRLRL